MYISEHFGIEKGHENFDFVDIRLEKDTKLFIDPCLIETGGSEFCLMAKLVLESFYDEFFKLYRMGASKEEKLELLKNLHERNEAKLGYGNGKNGKAKTDIGALETFQVIETLLSKNIPLEKAIDLPLYIVNFAEDCMSDMLINILFSLLNDFTIDQCKKYGIKVEKAKDGYFTWDIKEKQWKERYDDHLIINKSTILLVPKEIVHSNFYYNTSQFIRSQVIERLKRERTVVVNGKENAPSKGDIKKELSSKYSSNEIVTLYTEASPGMLKDYHRIMGEAYSVRTLSNEQLDNKLYGWPLKKDNDIE